jgi:serine/threonine protein kinase
VGRRRLVSRLVKSLEWPRRCNKAAALADRHRLELDSGEAGGFLYHVMPFVDGESLRDRLARSGELPVPEAIKIITELVDALSCAHHHRGPPRHHHDPRFGSSSAGR